MSPRVVPAERRCIWCGQMYLKSKSADDCFCLGCLSLPEESRGSARLQWMQAKLNGVIPPNTDLGQGVDEPWPSTFPICKRDKVPVPDPKHRPRKRP